MAAFALPALTFLGRFLGQAALGTGLTVGGTVLADQALKPGGLFNKGEDYTGWTPRLKKGDPANGVQDTWVLVSPDGAREEAPDMTNPRTAKQVNALFGPDGMPSPHTVTSRQQEQASRDAALREAQGQRTWERSRTEKLDSRDDQITQARIADIAAARNQAGQQIGLNTRIAEGNISYQQGQITNEADRIKSETSIADQRLKIEAATAYGTLANQQQALANNYDIQTKQLGIQGRELDVRERENSFAKKLSALTLLMNGLQRV